jgi:hypothetical protein
VIGWYKLLLRPLVLRCLVSWCMRPRSLISWCLIIGSLKLGRRSSPIICLEPVLGKLVVLVKLLADGSGIEENEELKD